MRILVACEESQAVTKELRRLGHEAYSCDLQSCGGYPSWHLKVDALELLKMKWDMIIAHPPCTYLTTAGAIRLYSKDHAIADEERYEKGLEAARFFMAFYNADCPPMAQAHVPVVEGPSAVDSHRLTRRTDGLMGWQHEQAERSHNCREIHTPFQQGPEKAQQDFPRHRPRDG